MKALWEFVLRIMALVLMGYAIYWMLKGEYAHATFDLLLAHINQEAARRLAAEAGGT